MSVTVTKTGPYYASGSISWSSMRSNFKESSSGSISCSELFQNTNINDTDPVVPHSTENDQSEDLFVNNGAKFVFSGNATNWKASLMRNSVKRYTANQSGIDSNLDLGLYTASGGKGIDWDGQGVADAAGSVNGNYTRNIQKIININGSANSQDSGVNGEPGGGGTGSDKIPACRLVLPNPLKAVNVKLNNSGSIVGAGGKGGYYSTHQTNSDPGKDGGPALQIFHEGSQNGGVLVNNTGQIFGGGGSGEQGAMGFPGSAGQCIESGSSTTTYIGGFYDTCSGGGGSCNAGDQLMGTVCFWQIDCDGDGSFDGSICGSVCESTSYYSNNYGSSTTPVPGIGGAGGNGEGSGQPRQNGFQGTNPVQASCTSGGSLEGGSIATGGGAGGNGGAYGQPGDSTVGVPGDGGRGGSAICGKNYTLSGSTGAANVKGAIDLLCDGAAAPIPDPVGDPKITVGMLNGKNKHVRFNRPATHLHVTSRHPNDPEDNNKNGGQVAFRILDEQGDRSDLFGLACKQFSIKDPVSGNIIKTFARNNNTSIIHQLTLGPGSYEIEWVGLHPYNSPTAQMTHALPPAANAGTLLNYDENAVANYAPDDKDGVGADPTEQYHDRRNPNVFGVNDQVLTLRDGEGTDINRKIVILPEAGFGSNSPSWVRSWDVSLGHNNANDFPAVNNLWHQFMRDLAVTTSNITPQTNTSFGSDDIVQQGSWSFTASSTGVYTIKARSDNNAKFYWGYLEDLTPSNAEGFMETTPYDSHGANFGIGQAPTGFSELGRIWPYTSEGGNGQVNWFSSGWSRQLNASGQPNQGCTYWQINVQTLSKVYVMVRLVNQPLVNPSDPNGNQLWSVNPNGVAFEIYAPDNSTIVARSTDILDNPVVFGLPEVQWSVTGVDHNTPPAYMQGSSQALNLTGTKPEFFSDNGFNDSVGNVSTGTAIMKPQCNNDGTQVQGVPNTKGMEYTFTGTNTVGVSDEKKIIIN